MSDIIKTRCKYCHKDCEVYEENPFCSEPCKKKYEKYMALREKTNTPFKILGPLLLMLYLISLIFFYKIPFFRNLSRIIEFSIPIIFILFPFGEDKGLRKRGVKKTKILFRLVSVILLFFLIFYR